MVTLVPEALLGLMHGTGAALIPATQLCRVSVEKCTQARLQPEYSQAVLDIAAMHANGLPALPDGAFASKD